MAEFKITQTNYDFTSKRVSASVLKQDGSTTIFITINIPFEAPSNIPATELLPLIQNIIRKTLIEASQFNS